MENLELLIPKMILAALVVAMLPASSLLEGRKRRTALMAVAVLLAVGVGVDVLLAGNSGRFWADSLVVDGSTIFADLVILVLVFVLVVSRLSGGGQEEEEEGDFLLLLLLAALGASVLASAGNLLVLFLGLEITIIPTYALVAFRMRESRSYEAGLKYFVLSVMATALLLYGLSLVYGTTGSVLLPPAAEEGSALLYAGLGLVLVGFGFKLAVLPFHQWMPDAFEVSPPEVASFLAVGPKVAAVAVLIRLLDGLPAEGGPWVPALIFLAVASMVGGNLMALRQENLRRMLAYSAVAHGGYAFIGLAAGNAAGADGALLYFAAYGIGALGAFLVVAVLERAGQGDLVQDTAGLARRAPLLAAAMTVFLVSLIGIPLFSGFWGKLSVFWAAVQADMTWLAVIGTLNSAAALGYYGDVLRKMYMEEAVPGPGVEGRWGSRERGMRLALIVTVVITLLIGLAPGLLLEVIR